MGFLADLFDTKTRMQNRIKEYDRQIDLMNTEKALIAKRAERDKLLEEMRQLRGKTQTGNRRHKG